MMDDIIQFLILVSSASVAYFVTNESTKIRLIGYYIGLISQPLWFYTSLKNEQWGIFLLSIWYTYCWITGIIKNRF